MCPSQTRPRRGLPGTKGRLQRRMMAQLPTALQPMAMTSLLRDITNTNVALQAVIVVED